MADVMTIYLYQLFEKERQAQGPKGVNPSVKCKGFVVLDREMYIKKARAILEDKEGYKRFKKNPMRKVKMMMARLWRDTATDEVPQRLMNMLIP